MAIRAVCDACFSEFKAKDEHAGRSVNCPDCGADMLIPSPGQRGRRSAARQSSGNRSGRRRSKPQASGVSPIIAGGIGAAIVLAIGGIGYALFGSGNSSDSYTAGATTTAIETSATEQASPPTGASIVAGVPQENAAAEPATTRAVPQDVQAGSPNLSSATALASTRADTLPRAHLTDAATGTNGSQSLPSTSTPGNSPDAAAGESRRNEPFANLADLIEAVEPSVIRVNAVDKRGGKGNGSGYVVDREGTIVTNRHVIAGAVKLTGVFANDDTEYPITGLYSIDEKRDIAILKIDCPIEKLKPLVISTAAPRKGEELVAFGAPLGLDFTASEGILSATRDAEDLARMGISGLAGDWMQHTVPISPGNSGGPLVNMKGELIGMNTMQLTIGQNLNFAISSADVAEALSRKSTVEPLKPEAVPVLVRKEEADEIPKIEVVDIAGTDQARKYLAKLSDLEVIMLALGFDPTRRVTATVRSDLLEAIEKADVRRASRSKARMFVGMRLRSAAGAVGTQSVTITTMVHYLDLEGDKPTVYLIWNEEEKAGTVAGQAFLQGIVPARLRSGIKTHFRKFMGAVNTARREHGTPDKS
jgi:S1-C subfamily serine protease